MILRRLGYTVLMIERGRHPRFAIGESSTPFANLLLERLAAEYDLPFLRSFAEWGTWQKQFPQVSCGLKRGFSFFHHRAGEPANFSDRSSQLLVAASPNDPVADTHWYRPEFDEFLVRETQRLGVVYVDQTIVESCHRDGAWTVRLKSSTDASERSARFLIDATGPNGVLAEQLKISSADFSNYPRTHAIYAHFKGVRPLDQFADFGGSPPYPPDAAALHHVFADGWIWVLRFNNGITSAGAALTGPCPEKPEETWKELLKRFPSIAQQFETAAVATPFYAIPRLSFHRTRAAGPGWALLPSAAGFVDPLLSTGFALNLLGISRLALALGETGSPDLSEYERLTFAELDAAADLIGALYAKMNSFPEFAALSLLYFAAMSFTETAWRLEKRDRARMFLLSDDRTFTAIRQKLCAAARSGHSIGLSEVARLIAPWDIAGLGDLKRRHWYPVSLDDLASSPEKLGATGAEVEALIRKSSASAPIARAAAPLV